MKTFDLQGIELLVPAATAFAFIADAAKLPKWTNAFASVSNGRAIMRTPSGEVAVELTVEASAQRGTVDWRMTFPDRSVATACSRIVPLGSARCVYTFVLTPPPVPLEQLEGALEAQSQTLTHELGALKGILERS